MTSNKPATSLTFFMLEVGNSKVSDKDSDKLNNHLHY